MSMIKILRKSVFFVSILTIFALSGCWPIPASTSTATSTSTAPTTGQVTVYTITPSSYFSYANVYIDGVYVDFMRAGYSTVPTCGTTTSNSATKTVDAGTHVVTIYGYTASGAAIHDYTTGALYTSVTTTVTAGGCKSIRYWYTVGGNNY